MTGANDTPDGGPVSTHVGARVVAGAETQVDQRWVRWHLVKYQPSVRRGEPINIGLIAFDTTAARAPLVRLLEGELRPAAAPADNYDRWVAYFDRAHRAGTLEQVVDRWTGRSGSSNYFVGTVGHTLPDGDESFADTVDRLFTDLVLPLPTQTPQ